MRKSFPDTWKCRGSSNLIMSVSVPSSFVETVARKSVPFPQRNTFQSRVGFLLILHFTTVLGASDTGDAPSPNDHFRIRKQFTVYWNLEEQIYKKWYCWCRWLGSCASTRQRRSRPIPAPWVCRLLRKTISRAFPNVTFFLWTRRVSVDFHSGADFPGTIQMDDLWQVYNTGNVIRCRWGIKNLSLSRLVSWSSILPQTGLCL